MNKKILIELSNLFSSIKKEVFLVGGAVRDFLLCKNNEDFDFVTNATLDEIKFLFPNADYSFIKFGFVKINFLDQDIDISLLRKEIYSASIRHPSKIIFVDNLLDDSYRRDFTCNALYMDKDSNIFDYHHGKEDIANKILRMIGDPNLRFKEDPLRILRAVRFSIQLDFIFDEELEKAIFDNLDLLFGISRYSISLEIKKMKEISLEKFVMMNKKFHLDHFVLLNETKRNRPYIDLHCDTISKIERTKQNFFFNNLHVDIHKLNKGQCLMQSCALFLNQKDDIYERFNAYYDCYLKQMNKYKNYLLPVLKFNDINKAKMENKIGILLTVEEGEILSHISLDELYKKGVRLITLTWNYQNKLGNSHFTNKGLTSFGKEIVKKMNELGMIIDVSHLSDVGFFDVIKLSSQPIVASHSNSRSVTNVSRNLTDEMILALKKNGGVMGINFYHEFIKIDNKDDLTSMVEHIKHIKELGCLDHVCLGSDFDGIETPNELSDCSKIYLLEEKLLKNGFTKNEINKIFYKNVLRVIKNVLK